MDDVNETDATHRVRDANIEGADGQRRRAFIHPVHDRPNLTVEVGSQVTRSSSTATSAYHGRGATVVQHRASREVILALGSIQTPKLLQLSGIGPSDVLRAAGIDVRIDQPNVGARMREHHCFGCSTDCARTSATTASSAARWRRR